MVDGHKRCLAEGRLRRAKRLESGRFLHSIKKIHEIQVLS